MLEIPHEARIIPDKPKPAASEALSSADLRDEMSAIARTARSMEYSFDGISEKFRFQRNLTDETLLARGRAFATEAVANQADFIAYGLPDTFIADLTATGDAFEATFASAASATAGQIAATAIGGSSVLSVRPHRVL